MDQLEARIVEALHTRLVNEYSQCAKVRAILRAGEILKMTHKLERIATEFETVSHNLR